MSKMSISFNHLQLVSHLHIHRALGIGQSVAFADDAESVLLILEYPLAIDWIAAFPLIYWTNWILFLLYLVESESLQFI